MSNRKAKRDAKRARPKTAQCIECGKTHRHRVKRPERTAYHDVSWTCIGCGVEGFTSAWEPGPILHTCTECKAGAEVREALRPRRTYIVQLAPGSGQLDDAYSSNVNAKTEAEAIQLAKRQVAHHSQYSIHDLDLMHIEVAGATDGA